MRIATRFSIAVHVLALLGMEPDARHSSEYMAESAGVNPVMVRNVMGMLRRAGLVSSSQGKAGARLARGMDLITLLDVYRAVDAAEDLFAIHPNSNQGCVCGAHIEGVLGDVLTRAQSAMETELASTTLERVVDEIRSRA